MDRGAWQARVHRVAKSQTHTHELFCCCSVSQSCLTLWPHELQHTRLPCPSPISQSLLKLMSIESVMPSNHLILYDPLLLLPSIFPSIRVFFSESVLRIMWPKCWNFSFISPSNEHSGLISFRIDWFDLTVQRTLKSLPQHHNSKDSFWCLAKLIQLCKVWK